MLEVIFAVFLPDIGQPANPLRHGHRTVRQRPSDAHDCFRQQAGSSFPASNMLESTMLNDFKCSETLRSFPTQTRVIRQAKKPRIPRHLILSHPSFDDDAPKPGDHLVPFFHMKWFD